MFSLARAYVEFGASLISLQLQVQLCLTLYWIHGKRVILQAYKKLIVTFLEKNYSQGNHNCAFQLK